MPGSPRNAASPAFRNLQPPQECAARAFVQEEELLELRWASRSSLPIGLWVVLPVVRANGGEQTIGRWQGRV